MLLTLYKRIFQLLQILHQADVLLTGQAVHLKAEALERWSCGQEDLHNRLDYAFLIGVDCVAPRIHTAIKGSMVAGGQDGDVETSTKSFRGQ